jgi:hypothetical protein
MSVNKWKLIAVNLLVTFVLFNLAYWSLPVLSLLLNIRASITVDERARLPNYAKVSWATAALSRVQPAQIELQELHRLAT